MLNRCDFNNRLKVAVQSVKYFEEACSRHSGQQLQSHVLGSVYDDVAGSCRPRAAPFSDTGHGDTEIRDVMWCEIVHCFNYKRAQLEHHSLWCT